MSNRAPDWQKCSYYLRHPDGEMEIIGSAEVHERLDFDDAFPVFHLECFPDEHFHYLRDAINSGSMLLAVNETGAPQMHLAYKIDRNSSIWYGRESTLIYFGIDFRPAS